MNPFSKRNLIFAGIAFAVIMASASFPMFRQMIRGGK